MIGYHPMGRHGNAYFQAAACIALALRNGVEYSMPTHTSNETWSPLCLYHLRNPKWQEGVEHIRVLEPNFHYSPIEYNKSWDDKQVILQGYYQSEKFFIDFKNEVIDLFAFPWKLKKGFVSVHLRRTDFLELKNKHPEVTDDWYNEAMSKFPNKKFLFFSDEIEYAKRVWGHRGDCYFSEGKTIEQDLIDMSCCEHNICSASTFAWWAMYLNRNEKKKVIFPKLWFVRGWNSDDTKDLLPEWVIKL